MNRLALASLLVPCALFPGGWTPAPSGAPNAEPAAISVATRRAADLFPPAREGLTIVGNGIERPHGEGGSRMDDLLAEYGRVTGMTVCFDKETAGLLRATATPNVETIEVAPARVHATVQGLLFLSGFVVVPLTEDEPHLLAVHSLYQRPSIKQNALLLEEEELEAYREYAALVVTVAVHFEHVDVRQLATSMRPLMPDQSTSSMLNAGSSDSLVLTAFAPQAASMVELFRSIDTQQAERLARLAAEAPPEEADGDDENGDDD